MVKRKRKKKKKEYNISVLVQYICVCVCGKLTFKSYTLASSENWQGRHRLLLF